VIPQAASYSSRHLKVKKLECFQKGHLKKGAAEFQYFLQPYGTVYLSLIKLHMST
jgi:hypothetical protein